MKMAKVSTMRASIFLLVITLATISIAQNHDNYDVNGVRCSFASQSSNVGDLIVARLKRPTGFKGLPLFADDRSIDPGSDKQCSIKPDPNDASNLYFDMKVTDFKRCGVLKRNGYVHIRIWFPQFTGVVMQSDQEVIIMCRPPEPTVIENKAAGFAGSFHNSARVSGIVEETPGRLEYEVSLYKESLSSARIGSQTASGIDEDDTSLSNDNELPVDQAVPIGTKLQIRARISTESAWKYVKLMEVTVSSDPDEAHAPGAVWLVRDGCRNPDFVSIIPHQPARFLDRPYEVFLSFEAFLLSSMRERATLWIHTQIKACMDIKDCQPEYCSDPFQKTGLGRRKRSITDGRNSTKEFTKFKENIEYTVIMPGDYDESHYGDSDCRNLMVMAALLGVLLAITIAFTCALVFKLHTQHKSNMDNFVSACKGYSGRTIVH